MRCPGCVFLRTQIWIRIEAIDYCKKKAKNYPKGLI